MDSQVLSHPHGHGTYEHDPHNVALPPLAEGENEHHHEKKSVLRKVKAKAKKIKETLTGHGHNHDHDHDHDYDYHRDERHIPDDHDLYEEDDEDEELFEDPEAFESASVRSAIPGQVENIGHSGISIERSTAMREDPIAPKERCVTKVTETIMVLAVPGHEENTGQSRVNFGKTSVMGEELLAPLNTPVAPGVNGTKVSTDPTKTFVPGQEGRMGQRRVNLERPMGLDEDPHSPKDRLGDYTPNYQTKATDPTGTGAEEAAGITPLLQSFDKMKVYDEPKPESAGTHHNLTTTTHDQFTNLPTGSHDQFSPEPVPPESQSIRDTPQLPESFDPNKPEDYICEKPSNQSSYTEKISSATSAIAEKAVSAKNVVASKLGYGEKDNNMSSEVHESGDYTKSSSESASPVEYGKKIAATVTEKEKLTPVYEKVAEAGSNVMSKVHGYGTDSTTGNVVESESTTVVEGQDKGASVKDHFMEKLRPGDEDRALSGVISDALHKRNEEPEKAEKWPIMGKVTESEEVARRLETERDENCGESMQESFVDNQAQGSVVDRLRGAVGTWFGLSGDPQSQAPQQSHGGGERISNSASGNVGYNSHAAEGRRLQESSN
ncbi:low-temperature-induced 65 kDa protein-like [Quercus lobata]|uniref:Low-temperature-induced 65 kDa protein n=1 Tax=Quercus lobata TaxID=97700 RepID=A0A7N2RAD5_QUELO|nr:low-temperature-induced 65 kDa protein-like [Quercus lobata]